MNIGKFSINSERKVVEIQSHPKLLDEIKNCQDTNNSQPFPFTYLRSDFNLFTGYEKCIKKYDYRKSDQTYPDNLSTLLEFLQTTDIKTEVYDFITWRGIMTRFMGFTTDQDDEILTLGARKCKSSILLFQLPSSSPQKVFPEYVEKIFYSGRAFETYCSGQNPETTPVNENEENCHVFASKVKNGDKSISLLFGAEMDGLDYELKTTAELKHGKQVQNLLMKTQRWWSQSYLSGVEKIFCGYRDRRGRCRKVSKINVRDLPKTACQYWSWQRSIDDLFTILYAIQSLVKSILEPSETLVLTIDRHFKIMVRFAYLT